jgi:hypothetical protein
MVDGYGTVLAYQWPSQVGARAIGPASISSKLRGVWYEHRTRGVIRRWRLVSAKGPHGAYPGCGYSSLLMIIAGILLVMAGMMRGCNM